MFKAFSNIEMFFGRGSRKNIVEVLENYNVKNILVIIGKNAVSHGIADMIYPLIDESKYNMRSYNDIKPNPTIDNVLGGLEVTKDFMPDIILSVGGGSVIDTAKAISLALANPEIDNDIRKLAVIDGTKHRCIPIIAVPTTCGTGTEVTQFFIITDEEQKIKLACSDINSFPIIAIVDSELMDGMPDSLAASTGMDALTHAIEAFESVGANPISDMYALKAIKTIFTYAEKAIKVREENAKEEMALAQYLAGYSFANAGLGLVHAMAHQLGGFYDLPHGLCNAILLPQVIRFNGRVASDKYRTILKELGVDTKELSMEEIVDIFCKKISSLNIVLGIDKKFAELGVKEEDLETLALNAMKDPCYNSNPIKATKEDIIRIYKESM